MIQSKVFLSDCWTFFDTITAFTLTIVDDWIIRIGQEAAQISDGLSNPVIAGIEYWLIRILILGGCLVVAGILAVVIGIKAVRIYKQYCWDMITIMVTLMSLAITIYFGDCLKTVLPINLL